MLAMLFFQYSYGGTWTFNLESVDKTIFHLRFIRPPTHYHSFLKLFKPIVGFIQTTERWPDCFTTAICPC